MVEKTKITMQKKTMNALRVMRAFRRERCAEASSVPNERESKSEIFIRPKFQFQTRERERERREKFSNNSFFGWGD